MGITRSPAVRIETETQAKPWRPHTYQKRALKWIVTRKSSALFLDPGMGKTSTTYAAIKVLKNTGQFKGALVIAPRRPAVSVWPQEQQEWVEFHDLKVELVHGEEKVRAIQRKADVYVMTHEGFAWALKHGHIQEMLRSKRVNMLVLDELSKYKNTGSGRFKALTPWLSYFDYRIGLTGSPAANGLINLFGQAYVLDSGRSLGIYVTHFKFNFFTPMAGKEKSDYPTLVPKEGAKELIFARMKQLAIRFDAKDYLKLPTVIPNVIRLDMLPAVRQTYDDMEEDMFALLTGKELVTAETAAAASMKCRQITSGALYHDKVDPLTGEPRSGPREWTEIHDQKVEAACDLVEELQGQQILIGYEFGHERDRLIATLTKVLGEEPPCIGGKTSDKKALQYEAAWNAGQISVLLGHPASMGHGLNFQKSSAYNVLWVSGTWDYELYDQFIRRLLRQGNTASHLIVHQLVFRNSVDEAVVASNNRKRRDQDELHAALSVYRKKRSLK